MDWIDWALLEPKNKKDIVSKIENDGYTYPHSTDKFVLNDGEKNERTNHFRV